MSIGGSVVVGLQKAINVSTSYIFLSSRQKIYFILFVGLQCSDVEKPLKGPDDILVCPAR